MSLTKLSAIFSKRMEIRMVEQRGVQRFFKRIKEVCLKVIALREHGHFRNMSVSIGRL